MGLIGRPPIPLEKRFWKFVDKNSSCWNWKGAKDYDGYGFIKHKDGTQLRAHRVSYEIHFGTFNKNLFVCHHCDNPSCVNPEHLFLGTNSDNQLDMYKKGLGPDLSGENNPASKLTLEEVNKIRADTRTHIKIATDYGISLGQISNIKRRKQWKKI